MSEGIIRIIYIRYFIIYKKLELNIQCSYCGCCARTIIQPYLFGFYIILKFGIVRNKNSTLFFLDCSLDFNWRYNFLLHFLYSCSIGTLLQKSDIKQLCAMISWLHTVAALRMAPIQNKDSYFILQYTIRLFHSNCFTSATCKYVLC